MEIEDLCARRFAGQKPARNQEKMNKKEELEIFISEEGEIKVRVRGARGGSCMTVLEKFAGKVGRIRDVVKTPEFYQEDVSTTGKIRQERRHGMQGKN